MTTPVVAGSSGLARNAAKRLPSAAWSTRSSWETAAPEITGIGGSESSSKHTAGGAYGRRTPAGAVDIPAMAEQSHREEMSAAIRAQRERHAVPRSIAPEPEPQQQQPEPRKRPGLLARLRRK